MVEMSDDKSAGVLEFLWVVEMVVSMAVKLDAAMVDEMVVQMASWRAASTAVYLELKLVD